MQVALNFADGRTHFVAVAADETIVDAALRKGIVLPTDCREGVCSTCRGTCVSGDYELRYAHEDALTQKERDEGAVLCCQMVPRSDCVIDFDFDSGITLAADPETIGAALSGVERVSDAVSILELRLPEGTSLEYLAGQYAHLRVPGTSAWRSYSFARAPNAGERLKFIVRTLPAGEMSDYLRVRVRVGDLIDLQGPFGTFYLRKVTRPVFFLAGGTGISAFLGMLDGLSMRGAPGQPVELLYGVTDAEDLCDVERLESYAATIPGFRFRTIAVNAPSGWTGARGLVTDLLDTRDLHGGDVDVYVCGPPLMVDAVRAIFRGKGLDKARLYAEKFSAS